MLNCMYVVFPPVVLLVVALCSRVCGDTLFLCVLYDYGVRPINRDHSFTRQIFPQIPQASLPHSAAFFSNSAATCS